MAFEILYLPVGKQMYNLEQAQMKLDDSVQVMKKIDKNILIPDGILLSKEDIDAFLQDKAPDFVIVQTVTYADASYITEILRKINCPVLLWSIPEPVVDGLGIRLNSLSGAYSQANAMLNLGIWCRMCLIQKEKISLTQENCLRHILIIVTSMI